MTVIASRWCIASETGQRRIQNIAFDGRFQHRVKSGVLSDPSGSRCRSGSQQLEYETECNLPDLDQRHQAGTFPAFHAKDSSVVAAARFHRHCDLPDLVVVRSKRHDVASPFDLGEAVRFPKLGQPATFRRDRRVVRHLRLQCYTLRTVNCVKKGSSQTLRGKIFIGSITNAEQMKNRSK